MYVPSESVFVGGDKREQLVHGPLLCFVDLEMRSLGATINIVTAKPSFHGEREV